jgi:hypothetical protein
MTHKTDITRNLAVDATMTSSLLGIAYTLSLVSGLVSMPVSEVNHRWPIWRKRTTSYRNDPRARWVYATSHLVVITAYYVPFSLHLGAGQTHYLLTSPFGKGGLGRMGILIEKLNDVITRYPLTDD